LRWGSGDEEQIGNMVRRQVIIPDIVMGRNAIFSHGGRIERDYPVEG
jgi:hypothetical protein